MYLLLLVMAPYVVVYLFLFALLIIRRKNGAEAIYSQAAGSAHISISVIVPLRNEESNIKQLTDALGKQEWPASLTEVILVDDNSTDNTFNLALRMTDGKRNHVVTRNSGSGKKDAIATGLNLATGELVVTTDADCSPGPRWLPSIASVYSDCRAELIIGPVYPMPGNRPFSRLLRLESLSVQAVTEATAIINHPVMASGANLAFARSVSEGYSNFIRPGIRSGDDMFMLHHAKREKRRIIYNNHYGGEVYTTPPAGFRAFLKQRIRWSGKGIKYNDQDTIIVGTITALTSIIITISLCCQAFIPGMFRFTLLCYLLKSIPDFLLLSAAAYTRREPGLLAWFIPLQAVYPVYVTFVVVAGIIVKPGWKE